MAHNWDSKLCKTQFSVSFITTLGSKVGLRFRRPARMGSSTLGLVNIFQTLVQCGQTLVQCGPGFVNRFVRVTLIRGKVIPMWENVLCNTSESVAILLVYSLLSEKVGVPRAGIPLDRWGENEKRCLQGKLGEVSMLFKSWTQVVIMTRMSVQFLELLYIRSRRNL
jgi:hypothetical protein